MPLESSPELEARTREVQRVLSLLVQRRYDELEALCLGVRLSAAELAGAVAEYGRVLVNPPGPELELDWCAVDGSPQPKWAVDVPLFSAEEGLSDLTLSLTLRRVAPGCYQVEIDNLHVL